MRRPADDSLPPGLRVMRRVPERLRRGTYRFMPPTVWTRYQAAIRYRDPVIDPAPLRRIASVPLGRLSDPAFLTHDLLPELGLTTHAAPDLFPRHLLPHVGRGVQSIQFPNQFGPYLASMTQAGVRTYLEVGVDRGGTFAITVEVLRRFGLRHAIGVDLAQTPILRFWNRPEVSFHRLDSRSEAFAGLVRRSAPIDLALIDGDHSEAGVRNDLEVLRPHARILAFHDIVQDFGYPDVGRVWRWIREHHAEEYTFEEHIDQYPELPGRRLGIGVAVRRPQMADSAA